MKLATWFAKWSVLLLVIGTAQFLIAQGTDLGTITGTVTDSSGALVPNASVTIIDLATNTPRETKSNAEGVYRVFGLRPGAYKVKVTAANMGTTEVSGIQLNGSDVINANAVLKIASTTQTLEVSAEAPLVNTDDQTISDTINSRAVIDLPRDSRDVYSFLYLNPNITQGSDDGEFKFLGAQSYGGNFTLDGQRSNGGVFGSPTNSKPSLEAVADINVLSNDFSAEYAGISNIRVTTKRGGSGYHGSAFYNNKNSALAAFTLQDEIGRRDFAPYPGQSHYPNPYFNLTDIGGSFGGPVPKLNKTWFFASYERNWNRSPVQFITNNLPHPTFWTGDFSLLPDTSDSSSVARKPDVPSSVVLTPAEIASDTVFACDDPADPDTCSTRFIQIPSRLLNPTTQALINTYFPKIGTSIPINSRGRASGFHTILPGNSVTDTGTLRVDHDFTDKDRVYVVYTASGASVANQPVIGGYTGLGLKQNERRNDTISISYNRAFNNNVINEARGGFNREHLYRHSNTTLEGFLSSIGFDQSDIDAYGAVVGTGELATFGHPAVSFGNQYLTFANGNRDTDRSLNQNLATFGDTLTWVVRKHSFKMGADFVRNSAQDGFAKNRQNVRGLITYGGSGANSFVPFLLGLAPTSVSYVAEPRPFPMDVYNWEHGYFFQDDWKVTPRLTLNLGIRYELVTPFIDRNDLLVNFDPNFVDQSTGLKGRFIVPSDKTLPFLDSRIADTRPVVTAAQSGLNIGRGLVRTDKNNIAPRVGFALRLGDKSVVRAGYGFYYYTSAAQGIRDPIATNGFNQSLTKRGFDSDGNPTPLSPWPGFAHGFSPLNGGTIRTGLGGLPSINAVPVDLEQPRIQQYNVTFEREILRDTSIRLSYLGSALSGLIGGVDLNEIPASDVPFATTIGDGVTPCDPVNNGDCDYSPADLARQPLPGLGDFLASYGNFGHGRSNAFQAQLERRYSHGLMFSMSYTYLDQKTTSLDLGNSSLGGLAWNPFDPNLDYTQDSWLAKNRFVAYGVWDLPVGKGRKFGSGFSGWENAIIGGWQTTFNMFAKTGTAFTPFWTCNDCFPTGPGNLGVGSVDAVGDFNGPSFRPVVIGNVNHRVGDQMWDPAAFDLPPLGADVLSNPSLAKRNSLTGPGTWGLNLGVHKDFHLGDRFVATFGADVQNLFNHRLFSPNADDGGGGGSFAQVGDFDVGVDPTTLKPTIADFETNPDFGRLINTYTQEGVDSRRTIRLRLRITF
ncbi:MAG TPA: carboxypeptidase-like regulatory domain-containing protein [Terriglobales bacterium]|jgi:Carboxypeptidase regulatory-like domain/TonB dependent receptor|nr:carboxypeptidase-like regulatory domain-containing protein [Terriglobales bacterium]